MLPTTTVDLSWTDTILLATFLLTFTGKVAADIAGYLTARKHTALANIVGMAGREAAEIARSLASMPPTAGGSTLERKLVGVAADRVLSEMATSAGITSADAGKVSGIIQAEVSKLIAPAAIALTAAKALPSNLPRDPDALPAKGAL